MNPSNIKSLLLLGDKLDYLHFKLAFHYASDGIPVWLISANPINRLPKEISTPEKEVLKLLTFFYVKNEEELLKTLNGIHSWRKVPSVIILRNMEWYCKLSSQPNTYNPILSALLITSLIDCISTCGRINSRSAYLIVSCNLLNNIPADSMIDLIQKRIQILIDLYFQNVITVPDASKVQLEAICTEILHLLQ